MSDASSVLVFRDRPKPCAGDMRISWRVSMTLLTLNHSRAKKASFAKLHVLNDALRSAASKTKLSDIIDEKIPTYAWRLRVEPAFTRALELLVGEGFATWEVGSGRTILALSDEGKIAAKNVTELDGVLDDEKLFLREVSSRVTESFVQKLLSVGKRLL